MSFSKNDRQQFLNASEDHLYDLLVIGGGITGAGISLDAVDRGIDVCVLEKGQFASGTSSKSTKLIHAGIRYLKQFQIGLVKNTGSERLILSKLAPNLARPIRVIIPVFKTDKPGLRILKFGLWFFERIVSVPKGEKFQSFSKDRLKRILPKFKQDGLTGAASYYERLTTDSRLTIEVIKQSVKRGSKAINYFEATSIQKEGDEFRIKGIDLLTKKTFSLRSKQVINAGGPWLDIVRENDTLTKGKKLVLTKGVHIVVDGGKFFLKDAVYFSTPDGRMIFAIPKFDKVYIGTTDTFHKTTPDDLKVTTEDVEYLLHAVNHRTEKVNLSASDVEASWAGLRPLILEEGKSASEISRKDEIFRSPSGMYSIAGGKLTGYRLMAKKILDKLYQDTGLGSKRCNTHNIQIQSGELDLNKSLCVRFPDFDCLTLDKLAALFGDNATLILEEATILLKNRSADDALYTATKAYCEAFECLVKADDLETIHTDWAYFNQGILAAAK